MSENTDLRNYAQKTLTALEAVIEGRASLDQERYCINNRELYRMSKISEKFSGHMKN